MVVSDRDRQRRRRARVAVGAKIYPVPLTAAKIAELAASGALDLEDFHHMEPVEQGEAIAVAITRLQRIAAPHHRVAEKIQEL